jgi:hypothetical protein
LVAPSPAFRETLAVIFHPRGRVNGASSSVLHGLIEWLQVEVNGNGFEMHGTGPHSDDDLALIE